MDVELTDVQRELRDAVRAFATDRLAPRAAEIDATAGVPAEVLGALGDLGVLGCLLPEAEGGGVDRVAAALAVEELAAASAAVAARVAAHLVATTALGRARGGGTDAARLARGEDLACAPLGPAAMLRTTPRADGVAVEGRIAGLVGAADAAAAVVLMAFGDAPSAVVVARGTPGVSVVPALETSGLRGAATADLVLRRVPLGGAPRVPAGDVVGLGRVLLAAVAVGVARAAAAAALRYARERRAFGRALVDFQGTQWKLADMATAVEAARLLTLRAASQADRGLPYTREAATAKLHAAQTAMTVATQAVQIHGGYGYTREFPVERQFRDAATLLVVAGTPAAERRTIGATVLAEAGR